MPRHSIDRPLRCRHCGRRDTEANGPRAVGLANQRHGHDVQGITCGCGHRWWSTTARAAALTKAADAAAPER
jgi:hypothetical protein